MIGNSRNRRKGGIWWTTSNSRKRGNGVISIEIRLEGQHYQRISKSRLDWGNRRKSISGNKGKRRSDRVSRSNRIEMKIMYTGWKGISIKCSR